MKWAAVVVAAGRGARFGRPKQLIELAGLPMIGWSIQTFGGMSEIAEIVIATEPELIDPVRELSARLAPDCPVRVVRGGALRQASVCEGLRAVTPECERVLVHDGARPLVCAPDVRAGMREVREGRATLLASPVVDTIKVVESPSRRVSTTLDRRTLWAAQTPQFALTAELRKAHERAIQDGVTATDDAALLEHIGIEVTVIPSTSENFKVTLPADIARAEAILRERALTTGVG
ncbi:MAG TPA: 2-C-methyl-D-erythritol 4-phosphate cytidylyltransferase [Candidatus Cybelea sp.]|nr:2-C-methyl-D-erythritol 4-phosphate cytidylyltransferase [Candidatus Cybelea sp.]